jgi:hypothetical protein
MSVVSSCDESGALFMRVRSRVKPEALTCIIVNYARVLSSASVRVEQWGLRERVLQLWAVKAIVRDSDVDAERGRGAQLMASVDHTERPYPMNGSQV